MRGNYKDTLQSLVLRWKWVYEFLSSFLSKTSSVQSLWNQAEMIIVICHLSTIICQQTTWCHFWWPRKLNSFFCYKDMVPQNLAHDAVRNDFSCIFGYFSVAMAPNCKGLQISPWICDNMWQLRFNMPCTLIWAKNTSYGCQIHIVTITSFSLIKYSYLAKKWFT